MPKKKKKKARRISLRNLSGLFSWNIGTIIFGAIFMYMIISLVLYLTADHITSYQVTSGPLAQNPTFDALVLRSEQVVESPATGYVHQYARENAKVPQDGIICSISDNQESESGGDVELTEENLAQLRANMAKFAYNFKPNNFYDTYNFKYELQGNILQYAEDNGTLGTALGDQTVQTAPVDGTVLYTIDGYEELTEESLTMEAFNQKAYQVTNLKRESRVDAGEPVCKIVDSETWSLYIPLTDKQTVQLASNRSMRVKFLKDGETQVGNFSILTIGEQRYGRITFTSGMFRYSSDRFLEVELVTNTETGLKIPVSSVVEKEFYIIPASFETVDEGDNAGFLREVTDKDGNVSTEFVSATIYRRVVGEDDEGNPDTDNAMYYVDMTDFREGDILVKPDSQSRFEVKETGTLEGVYSINKGYAVFRQITIIDQNEEFCIVESGTSYGIAQFDHIVLDGSSVQEETILY